MKNEGVPLSDFATGKIVYIPEGWATYYFHFKVPNNGAHISLLAKNTEHAKQVILSEYPTAYDIKEIPKEEFISASEKDSSTKSH